jgi:hypothetical protein
MDKLDRSKFIFFKFTYKDEFFISDITNFETNKFLTPLVKPNIILLEQSSTSACILDLDVKKIFLSFPDPPPTRYSLSFFLYLKATKFDGGYCPTSKTKIIGNGRGLREKKSPINMHDPDWKYLPHLKNAFQIF